MSEQANNDIPTTAMSEFDRPIGTAENLKLEVFQTLREKGIPANTIRKRLGHLVIQVMHKSDMISDKTTPNDVERVANHVLEHLQ